MLFYGVSNIGIEFGTAGIGKDDVRSASFTLSHSSQSLTLDTIAQQNFGARLTSVGAEGSVRDGLVKPFELEAWDNAYNIVLSPAAAQKPAVATFCEWLRDAANQNAPLPGSA